MRTNPYLQNNFRRHPRTVQEAFGPHTSFQVEGHKIKTPPVQWVIYGVCAIGVAVVAWVM